MAALAASRRLLHIRPALELCLRSRATIPFSIRAKGPTLFRHGTTRRRLVSCPQCSHAERNAAFEAKRNSMLGTDEQLNHFKDGRALETVEEDFSDEFPEFSSEEEESDEMLCGIDVARNARESAIELLAVRAYTVSELRKKLVAKKYPGNAVNSVIADFKSRGLLNDGHYAESFSLSRWLSKTWGPGRIKQALGQKGVPEAEVDQATRKVFQDGHDHEHEAVHEISESSMDHLFAQASKQWLRGESVPLEKRRARIVRWLQYRGFSWPVTSAIVKKLDMELGQKEGMPEANVDRVRRRVFQDGHGHKNQTKHDISESSMDHLFAQASKQWLRGECVPVEKRRARVVRWLQYRGFTWAVINTIVKKLEAQHPP